MLLIDVKGATSFEDLRTVEGIQYLSFKQAAVARNLLQDDTSWDKAMEEAAAFQMPVQWRQLFVDIYSHNEISNAPRLFEKYWFHLAEDYIKNGHNDQVARNLALHWIKDKLNIRGIDMEKELNMPAPDSALIEHFIRGEARLNENIRRDRMLRGDMMLAQLNEGQREVFDNIMSSVNDIDPQSIRPRQFFLDGPGGTVSIQHAYQRSPRSR